MRASVVIAGGGIIGSAVAYCLAERGWRDVVVVDLDLAGIYASSELNAGGVRATWWQPVNIETCRQTLDFFRARRERFGFRERGYLWLYDDPEHLRIAREKQKLQNAQGLGVELLGPGEIAAHCPLLDSHLEEIVGATFSPRDGLINPNAVRAEYRSEAEAPGFDFAYDGADFFERFIWPRLAHRASAFERCGHVRGWSGLYAVTPDCSGIAGPVPGIANLYEAHSFTGRGVMQSYGVARALAERIVDGVSTSCDLAPLGRQRSATRESWLPESLHI